ncbi:MAG: hypothetical protein ACRDOE_02875 [Streptosporangiaceae bacterium]
MASERMSRRGMLVGAGVGTAALGALAIPGGSAFANDNHGENNSFLGGWLITRSDPSHPTPVQATLSFALGGAFASHDINPPGTPCLGTWAATDESRFVATMWTGTMDPTTTPPTINTVKVAIRGKLDDDGDSLSGTYTATVFDGSGTQVATVNGTFQGSPIAA